MSYANEGRISVNMRADLRDKLDRAAAARGMTRNALVVELIEDLEEQPVGLIRRTV